MSEVLSVSELTVSFPSEAGPVRAVRETSAAPPPAPETQVSPELTSRLIEACAAARPLRLVYRLGPGKEREMEIEPWAVVLRHSDSGALSHSDAIPFDTALLPSFERTSQL